MAISNQVSRVIAPLDESLASEQTFSTFLLTFGWDVPPSAFAIDDVKAAIPIADALSNVETILGQIQSPSDAAPVTTYLSLIEALRGIVGTMTGLTGVSAPPGIPADAWNTFTSELFNSLLVDDLVSRRPGITAALAAGGIVTQETVDPGGVPGRVTYVRKLISWDNLSLLVSDPTALARQVYDWSDTSNPLKFDTLLERIAQVFSLLGLPIETVVPSAALLDEFFSPSNPSRTTVRQVNSTLFAAETVDGSLTVSLFVLLDYRLGFKTPSGIGISVDAGSVSGGGFLFFDEPNGRYGGAIELLAYDISVKAFGLIETKVPGVSFSFVIVISAEFTPIQLGLGFTLDGVGGLLGINRKVDEKAVADAVKSGRLDHVLFPKDVVANAPAIISDLSTLFPAAEGRYLIGPMAKLSWLEIVHGTLGLILQWPSKKLTILGTIDAVLPNEDNAIVLLKMDVGGTLDFPKKHFELDAVLDPDSRVGDFKISGSMAMRLDWGNQPNFALSIGGFNKSYNPPPGFPALRRMTVDLGAGVDLGHITLEGYTALTSNTAQVGARLDASVSKYSATLSGFVSFDAIIVFSPFQFTADLSGGVHVDFHGVGFGMTLHGHISGPSPWQIAGEVCVSLWFADACVGFHEKLGGEAKPTLPSIDPWFGQPWSEGIAFADQEVGGLEPAIRDLRNWKGDLPPGAFVGVSYREQKPPVSRVDPVGVATFTQKVAPLDYSLDMFVGAPSGRTGELKITGVTSGTVAATPSPVKDFFAPAQYKSMSEAEKLSSESFESLDAGVAIVSQAVTIGAVQGKTIQYRTFELQEGGAIVERPDVHYTLSDAHLDGMATGASAARPLVRTTGRFRFIDPTLAPKLIDQLETYLVVAKSSLLALQGLPTGVTRTQAAALLSAAAGSSVAQKRLYQVIPTSFLAAA